MILAITEEGNIRVLKRPPRNTNNVQWMTIRPTTKNTIALSRAYISLRSERFKVNTR